MKPTIYTIALIALVMTAMWSAAAVKMEQPAEVKYAPVELTQAMYDAIQPGMTVDEVAYLIGCEPTSQEAIKDTVIAKWSNGMSRSIATRFIDKQLTWKSEGGLNH